MVLLAVVDPTEDFVPLAGGIAGVYIQLELPPTAPDDVQAILDEGFARLSRMGVAAEARLERGEPRTASPRLPVTGLCRSGSSSATTNAAWWRAG